MLAAKLSATGMRESMEGIVSVVVVKRLLLIETRVSSEERVTRQ